MLAFCPRGIILLGEGAGKEFLLVLRRALILAALLCSVWRAAGADTVCLVDGKTVEGKIERVDEDKLQIRTATGVVEYGREQVKSFSVVRVGPDGQPLVGPDGKPVVAVLAFKPKPLKLPFEVEGGHYVVKTDISDTVTKNASKAMEELYKAYADIFDMRAEPNDRKTEIAIFGKKEDFTKYAASLGVKPRGDALGFFRIGSDGSSQIVTYKLQGEDFNTMSTLYHEATHQFIAKVLGPRRAPTWVNEGLAVYMEHSQWSRDKLKIGVIPEKRLAGLQAAIRAGKHIPLAELVKRGPETYDGVCYAEGWSLVYFLVHANRGAYAKRFGSYFRLLKDGKDADEAFKECFPADMEKLEAAWKPFVMGLKAGGK